MLLIPITMQYHRLHDKLVFSEVFISTSKYKHEWGRGCALLDGLILLLIYDEKNSLHR